MKRLLPLLALIVCVSVYANQQKVAISGGFFTGKDYLDMTDTERRAYATGAINGMLVAPFFGAAPENLNWLKTAPVRCQTNRSPHFTSYIGNQTKNLEAPLNVMTFNALQEACRK